MLRIREFKIYFGKREIYYDQKNYKRVLKYVHMDNNINYSPVHVHGCLLKQVVIILGVIDDEVNVMTL